MTEQTHWEKDQARREQLEHDLATDYILAHLSKYARARLLKFMLDTATPISAVGALVLGLGELAVTEMTGSQKYALSLMFGGQLTEVRDDDLPF